MFGFSIVVNLIDLLEDLLINTIHNSHYGINQHPGHEGPEVNGAAAASGSANGAAAPWQPHAAPVPPHALEPSDQGQ